MKTCIYWFLLILTIVNITSCNKAILIPFKAEGDYICKYKGADYQPIFIKGVNLGATVPGTSAGQLAISSEQYARWFRMMAEAGFNTVRIFTLHFPRFYEEFAKYNMENPDKPLYLLQGVWLNEEFPDNNIPDLQTLTFEFDGNIEDVVDCMHGNKKIEQKYGNAYGNYSTNVSQWVIGFIIGRELKISEIETTNQSRYSKKSYNGKHLSISGANFSEVWITERLDQLIAYEIKNYNSTRPVAFSNWVELNPLIKRFDKNGQFGNTTFLDLNTIKVKNAPGGLFISYNIYPYYPNFLDVDEKYRVYDEMGLNPYLGYLRDLKEYYDYPILNSEFGLPTSWGNARSSPCGMNHGGITEEEQGKYTMRMFNNSYESGFCGAVVFSWMDEWFKTTWITHPFTSDRKRLWHNVCSPENNYGLIQFVPNPQYFANRQNQNFNYNNILQTTVWHDFTWFNVDEKLKSPLAAGDTLWIAFDTYDRNLGESTLPNNQKLLKNRAEFLVMITCDSARFYVTNAYNMQGAMFMNCFSPAFKTKLTDGEPWIEYKWQNNETNKHPNIFDIGKLSICKGNDKLKIHNAVQLRNDGVYVRIPWMLLHFSDPSSAMVIDDDSSPAFCLQNWGCGMKYMTSKQSDGIAVTTVYKNETAEMKPYIWNRWDEEDINPKMYLEEQKQSLAIIREGLKNKFETLYNNKQ